MTIGKHVFFVTTAVYEVEPPRIVSEISFSSRVVRRFERSLADFADREAGVTALHRSTETFVRSRLTSLLPVGKRPVERPDPRDALRAEAEVIGDRLRRDEPVDPGDLLSLLSEVWRNHSERTWLSPELAVALLCCRAQLVHSDSAGEAILSSETLDLLENLVTGRNPEQTLAHRNRSARRDEAEGYAP